MKKLKECVLVQVGSTWLAKDANGNWVNKNGSRGLWLTVGKGQIEQCLKRHGYKVVKSFSEGATDERR